ncbi:ribonuclease H1-like [Chelonus insularis]|uniref:ribonuclease H1-like n=1 Tax=Chelonus insularis TaxID=460826 RepID=UPI00158AFD5E|nr:ribonuclease H1-like [Chelonus insularis]
MGMFLFRYFFWNLSLTKMNYYAVAHGRCPGIYDTWNECKDQVNKFPGAVFKKFSTKSEAKDFIATHTNSSSRHKGKQASSSSLPPKTFSSRSQAPVSKVSRKTSLITGYFEIKPSAEKNKEESKRYSHYNNSSSSQSFMRDADGRVDIYTDGACSDNGRRSARAGIGVYFGDNHPENVSKPINGRATNNRAEIEAVIEAANIAKRHGMEKIRINTDSEFLINCQEKWMPKWKAKGWKTAKNQPVINKEELIRMEEALAPLDVEFLHVRGHHGVHGNEMADKLARKGAEQYS